MHTMYQIFKSYSIMPHCQVQLPYIMSHKSAIIYHTTILIISYVIPYVMCRVPNRVPRSCEALHAKVLIEFMSYQAILPHHINIFRVTYYIFCIMCLVSC